MPPTKPAGTFGSYVRLDPAGLAEVMRSPSGPFVRRLIADGELVKQEARRLVGVHRPRPGERRARRPGQLRDSIVKRLASDKGMPVVLVGSADPIALLHHEGTRPHTIRARPGGWLVFWSDRAGRTVYAKVVNHPGTRPNRYLTNALAILRRRYS